MKQFLAVDFGTSQTSVALLKEGSKLTPEVIEIDDGQTKNRAIPTVLQLDSEGKVAYFGSKAVENINKAPDYTFRNFKVNFGGEAPQGKYTPDLLTFLFLQELRKRIEDQVFNGAKLSSHKDLICIIGCPSDWTEAQKDKLRNTAHDAGFPNVKLCDEPVAVIYYNNLFAKLNFEPSQNILVYDFGGGTTDVSIARIDMVNGEVKPSVLKVAGLNHLGGSNFDAAILEDYVAKNNYDINALPIKDSLFDIGIIGMNAKAAKEKLSEQDHVERTIPRLKVTNNSRGATLALSRKEFMNICADLISQFDEPIYGALGFAGLLPENIDAVILAGGSSSMPYVKEKMSKIFKPNKIFMSPSTEVVAQGLAAFGRAQDLNIKIPAPYSDGGYTAPWQVDGPIPPEPGGGKKKWTYLLIALIAIFIVLAVVFVWHNRSMEAERAKLQDQLIKITEQNKDLQDEISRIEAMNQGPKESVPVNINQSPSQEDKSILKNRGTLATVGGLGGAAAGAAAGAAIGSFFPVVGTTIGGIIGGVIGGLGFGTTGYVIGE